MDFTPEPDGSYPPEAQREVLLADISAFFHDGTGSVSYLVADSETNKAAIIDPVLDYDPSSGRITTEFAERLVSTIRERKLSIDWILETHVHADHLSAAQILKARLGGKVGIGAQVRKVQTHWAKVFNIEQEFEAPAKHFDMLFEDESVHAIGELSFKVMHTPGHTPADVAYLIGDAAFVGDALFMPDYGTARADFPGGCAKDLYGSIRRILALPPATRLFSGHDYLTAGRTSHAWESTVGQQRISNIHVHDGIAEENFIALRQARDARLALPNLIYPAVQTNIRGGHLPPPDENGSFYFKTPSASGMR
jgi:glyoxylase-like metal-dependent hydrolase (beta-lactamase superfamily II)